MQKLVKEVKEKETLKKELKAARQDGYALELIDKQKN